jgi:hypothetical protein
VAMESKISGTLLATCAVVVVVVSLSVSGTSAGSAWIVADGARVCQISRHNVRAVIGRRQGPTHDTSLLGLPACLCQEEHHHYGVRSKYRVGCDLGGIVALQSPSASLANPTTPRAGCSSCLRSSARHIRWRVYGMSYPFTFRRSMGAQDRQYSLAGDGSSSGSPCSTRPAGSLSKLQTLFVSISMLQNPGNAQTMLSCRSCSSNSRNSSSSSSSLAYFVVVFDGRRCSYVWCSLLCFL